MNSQFYSDAKQPLPISHVAPFSQSHSYFMKLQPVMSLLRFHTFSLLLGISGKFCHQECKVLPSYKAKKYPKFFVVPLT